MSSLLVLHGQDMRSSFEFLDQEVSCSFWNLQDLQETLFFGAAGEVPFNDFTAGVISSTDSTSILLLV